MARTVVASDSFSYSDGALPSVSGGNWAGSTLTGYLQAKVVSGQLTGASGGGESDGTHRWIGSGTFTDDQFSSLVFVSKGGSTGNVQGVTVRASADTDANRDHYFLRLSDSDTGLADFRVGKIVNGTETVFTTLWGRAITSGDRIELQAYGTKIRALHNGNPIFAVIDTSLTTGTPGITGSVGESWRFDSWEGGNLSDSMVVTVVKSIGSSGRQYSTMQAWEDAAPTDLMLFDVIWKGELYNDSEFVITDDVLISATVDQTRYFWLSVAAGHSFVDHANKATNPLEYDQSKGVGIRCTHSGYQMEAMVYAIGASYSRFDRFQIWNNSTGTGGNYPCLAASFGRFENLLIKRTNNNGNFASTVGRTSVRPATFINCVFLSGSIYAYHCDVSGNGNAEFHNCTMIGSGAGLAILASYMNGLILLKNTAVLGWATVCGGTGWSSFNSGSNYNATDVASPGTNWGANSLTSLTAADQVESGSSPYDARTKAGADLIGAGTRDQTYTNDLDIVGKARSTTAPTIGAWEFGGGFKSAWSRNANPTLVGG